MLPFDFDLLSQISLLSFGLAFAAGLIMGFSPASFPLLSVVTGYVLGSAGSSRWRAFRLSLAFILGIATIYTAFGVLFALAGDLLAHILRFISSRLPLWNLLIAAVLGLLGLHMAGVRRFHLRALTRPVWREVDSPAGAYLMGIPFGLAACPSCVPMLLAILVAAGATGQGWYGGALLFTFSLGFGLPLVLIGTFAGWLKRGQVIARYVPAVEKLGGWALLLASGYFFAQFIQLSFFL